MACDWLKIETNTPDKPEVIGIADMLGIPPTQAFGGLFMVWRWFDQHTTEGNASYVTKVTVDRLAGNAGFADAMVKVGWLVIADDGTITLPHFDRHNGETAKQRGLTAKRVAKNKAKGNGEANAPSVSKVTDYALPREREEIEEEVNLKPSVLASVECTEIPAGLAGTVCARLKKSGITALNPSNPKLEALLKAGATADELGDIADEPNAKKSFAWVLAVAEGRRRDAAAAGVIPQARGSPRKPTLTESRAATIAGLTSIGTARPQEPRNELDITGTASLVAITAPR